MKKVGRRWSAVGVALFFVLVGISYAQPAIQVGRFTMDEELTSEVTLKTGVAVPLGHTRSSTVIQAETGKTIPWGAKTGGVVDMSYQWYAIPQLSFGVNFGGQWYGYEYKSLEIGNAVRTRHSGWGVYSFSALIGTRFQLGIYGLYFTANVQFGYALMQSPHVVAIYANEETGDVEKTLMSSQLSGNLYLSGGMGVQYRFKQRWIGSLNFNYCYMPTTALGSNQQVAQQEVSVMKFNISSFVISAGISYAF